MLKTLKKLFGGGKKVKSTKRQETRKGATRKRTVKAAKKVVKVAAKKAVKKAAKPVKKTVAPKPIGRVTHYYGGIKVAIIKFSKDIKRGTEVRFSGATTDFVQKLESMQYDHKEIAKAPKGKLVGAKAKKRVREGDKVYEAR